MKWFALMMSMLMLPACAGEFDMFTNGEETPSGWGSPSPNGPSDPNDPDVPGVQTEELTPGFNLNRDEVRLLPFHVRVEKLTRVTGLDATDPLFDQLMSSRYDLGDHNYGQGIGPDLSWNASKMATWVRAIQPLCASEAMATRYALPQNLGSLITAAYGREAGPEELADFETAMSGQGLDEAAQYEATCVAVLTSSEFVAQ